MRRGKDRVKIRQTHRKRRQRNGEREKKERELGFMGSRLALQGGRELCRLHRRLTCREQDGKGRGGAASRRGERSEA